MSLHIGDRVKSTVGKSGTVVKSEMTPSGHNYIRVEFDDGTKNFGSEKNFTGPHALHKVSRTTGHHRRTTKDVEDVLLNSPASYRAWVRHHRPNQVEWLKLCRKWAAEWTKTGKLPKEIEPE